MCRAASEQRLRLDKAAKCKASIEAGIKALSKSGQQEDADSLQACIATVQQDAVLLQEEVKAGQEALDKFEMMKARQAKLDKAVKEGNNSAMLARALQVCGYFLYFRFLLTVMSHFTVLHSS